MLMVPVCLLANGLALVPEEIFYISFLPKPAQLIRQEMLSFAAATLDYNHSLVIS